MPQSIFTPESSQPRSWKNFAASYTVELLGVLLIAQIAAVAPKVIEQHRDEHITYIATPREATPPPPPPQHIQAPPQQFVKRIEPPKIEPKIETPPPPVIAKVEPPPMPEPPKPEPPKPQPKVETGKFDAAPVEAPKPSGNPNKPIETGMFSGSSAKPTVKAEVSKVQTGGFGDPNGVPVGKQTNDHPALTVAKVGSFDLPQGDGYGNGSGGTKGIRGVVASSGFGNGVAGPGNGDRGGVRGGSVKSSGFGDATAPVNDGPKQVAKAAAPAPMTPVEILDKPKPAYTSEARQMKIQGEVLLKVVFRAGGDVQVLGVERGLGHGLDESAVAAAQKIRFKPAKREGQAVDYSATVHIVFELAS